MSLLPSGPGARPNRSWLPSRDSEGLDSPAAVLTAEPMFVGADQGSPTAERRRRRFRAWPAASRWERRPQPGRVQRRARDERHPAQGHRIQGRESLHGCPAAQVDVEHPDRRGPV